MAYLRAPCAAIVHKFQSISNQLTIHNNQDNFIDSDHIIFSGIRYEPDYNTNMSGGDIAYRPVGGGGANGMQLVDF